ncbi:MAG: hypothetical protein O3B65_00970 [Chloroflexi bacterium]|nr:hypothetical protein [Chloroflexota bacterium]
MSDGLLFLILAIVGTGAAVGGVVFYRGSTTSGKRAIGASLTAIGVVIWLALAFIVPVSSSSS